MDRRGATQERAASWPGSEREVLSSRVADAVSSSLSAEQLEPIARAVKIAARARFLAGAPLQKLGHLVELHGPGAILELLEQRPAGLGAPALVDWLSDAAAGHDPGQAGEDQPPAMEAGEVLRARLAGARQHAQQYTADGAEIPENLAAEILACETDLAAITGGDPR